MYIYLKWLKTKMGSKRKRGEGRRLNDSERLQIIKRLEHPCLESMRSIAWQIGITEKVVKSIKKKGKDWISYWKNGWKEPAEKQKSLQSQISRRRKFTFWLDWGFEKDWSCDSPKLVTAESQGNSKFIWNWKLRLLFCDLFSGTG